MLQYGYWYWYWHQYSLSSRLVLPSLILSCLLLATSSHHLLSSSSSPSPHQVTSHCLVCYRARRDPQEWIENGRSASLRTGMYVRTQSSENRTGDSGRNGGMERHGTYVTILCVCMSTCVCMPTQALQCIWHMKLLYANLSCPIWCLFLCISAVHAVFCFTPAEISLYLQCAAYNWITRSLDSPQTTEPNYLTPPHCDTIVRKSFLPFFSFFFF